MKTYGQIVAERFKEQYYTNSRWATMREWEIQPQKIHTILLELTSKEAIEALLDKSWTKKLPKRGAK